MPARAYVFLNNRWLRLDVRGNKPSVNAQFDLVDEKLAFAVDPAQGEQDYTVIFAEPAPSVIHALTQNKSFAELWANLPNGLENCL